jgi:lipopolysaccharide export system permease protein
MNSSVQHLTYTPFSYFLPFYGIWGRYFFKEVLKVFALFIVCFYGLYILVDFSSHASTFHHHHVSFRWKEVAIYYLCDFVKRMEVLIPFAMMVATIKTLCGLNIHNELVALLASGIKLKTLLRPFVFIGLFFVLLAYLNTEFILPAALGKIKQIDQIRSSQKNKTRDRPSVQHVILEDESTLIFQDYDTMKERFSDAYWIRSMDDIFRMKYLYPHAETTQGEYVDHLVRDESGQLVIHESNKALNFPDLKFNNAKLMETLTQPSDLSIGALNEKLPSHFKALSEKEAQMLSVYYYKLAMPWLCLLAVIAPAPFCIRFTRQLPIFFIYAISIFGLVAFYLIMDAFLVLGSRQVMPPAAAIFIPFSLFFGFFWYRYIRLN